MTTTTDHDAAHAAIIAELNAQVVSEHGFTRGELSAVFDTVADPANWKLPIDATCRVGEQRIVHEAIVFFTGSVPNFTRLDAETLNVTAVGYYRAVGA